MGQCVGCARLRVRARRRSSQYRHKRFEFNPTRKLKFRDSAIRNELSIRNQDALDDDLSPLSGVVHTVVNSNQRGRGTDEEKGVSGEVRMSGRLVFSDEWDEATPIGLETAEEETEVRGRSGSNSSEKMGRFEVWTLEDSVLEGGGEEGGNERSKLIDESDEGT